MATKITVTEAAEMMNVNPQFIREGLKAHRLPIGVACLMPGGRWSYLIYKEHVQLFLDGKLRRCPYEKS